jgi:hypothetical protein
VKTCLCCGVQYSEDVATCRRCGEASWSVAIKSHEPIPPVSASVAVESEEPSTSESPEPTTQAPQQSHRGGYGRRKRH